MYPLIKRLLFTLSPEVSHDFALEALGAAHRLKLTGLLGRVPSKPCRVMGLMFDNPVGLAAGLDKNGDYFNALGTLGFGFVEIGTVTPLPQPGNPAPRLFRLPEQQAIINRMGFNNLGVQHLVEQVQQRRYKGILGINLGKNKLTPDHLALNDYILGMQAVYALADYITINISSPNTPGLRNLQFGDSLKQLMQSIKEEQKKLADIHQKYVPLAVKIAPDMSLEELSFVADTLQTYQLDAVIATNTTLSREGVQASPWGNESGGLSGAPLTEKSTQVIADLANLLQGSLPIIGVGGIMCAADAKAKFKAGASLIQLYSGFIYKGAGLIKECVKSI